MKSVEKFNAIGAFMGFLLFAISTIAQEFVPGEIILKLKKGVVEFPKGIIKTSISNLKVNSVNVESLNIESKVYRISKVFEDFESSDTIAKSVTGETVKLIDLSEVYRVEFPPQYDVLRVVEKYNKLKEVEYAEPNYIVHLYAFPDDPSFGNQWGLNTPNDADIDAPEAWDIETGKDAILCAIIDTGLDYTHNEFGWNVYNKQYPNPKIAKGKHFWSQGPDDDITDGEGHGTHVAGIIGALTNNGLGVAGVAGGWNLNPIGCKLLPIKVGMEKIQPIPTAVDIADGVNYARSMGARIINMSFGTDKRPQSLHDALWNAAMQGILLVAAMGNDDKLKPQYPAGWSEFICSVGAISSNGQRGLWGKNKGSNYGEHIDFVAPGKDVLSTVPGGLGIKTGTSMSAPFVSGIAALMLSYNPNIGFDGTDLEEMIKRTCKDLGSSGFDIYYGFGLSKARSAIEFEKRIYYLYHGSSNSTPAADSEKYTVYFASVHGPHFKLNQELYDLGAGEYKVIRHTRIADITFPVEFRQPPHVWVRPTGTKGWRYIAPYSTGGIWFVNDNYAEIQNITTTGCRLVTYWYEIWNKLNQFVGNYPCNPEEVTFAYTVAGPIYKIPPNPPYNLSVKNYEEDAIELTWDHDGKYLTEFWGWRRKEGEQYPINPSFKTIKNQLYYKDTGLQNGTTYYYIVKAVNEYGQSAQSNEANATTPWMNAPSLLDAWARAHNEIYLEWGDISKYEIGYKIERRVYPSGSFAVVGKLACVLGQTGHVDYYDTYQLQPSTTYEYRVFAYDSCEFFYKNTGQIVFLCYDFICEMR